MTRVVRLNYASVSIHEEEYRRGMSKDRFDSLPHGDLQYFVAGKGLYCIGRERLYQRPD